MPHNQFQRYQLWCEQKMIKVCACAEVMTVPCVPQCNGMSHLCNVGSAIVTAPVISGVAASMQQHPG
jgi:Asp/Glu/hydantoin racemase